MRINFMIVSLLGLSCFQVGCVSHYRAQKIEDEIMVMNEKLKQLSEQQTQTRQKHEAMFEHMSKELKRFNDEVLKSIDGIRRGSADDSVNILSLQELVQSMKGEMSELKFKLSQAKVAATQAEGEAIELPKDKNDLYMFAEERLREKKYRVAITAFSKFVQDHPSDIRADNSLYGMAEAYFQQTRYEEVVKVAERVLREYGDGGEADKMLMLLYEAYVSMDQCNKAIDSLNFLLKKYPRSNQTRTAKQRLKALEKRCKTQ